MNAAVLTYRAKRRGRQIRKRKASVAVWDLHFPTWVLASCTRLPRFRAVEEEAHGRRKSCTRIQWVMQISIASTRNRASFSRLLPAKAELRCVLPVKASKIYAEAQVLEFATG